MKKPRGNSNPTATLIINRISEEFPDAPSMTLAKKAFAENPGVFPTLDAARSNVRRHFGVIGKSHRPYAVTKREPRKAGAWQEHIPESVPQLIDWRAVPIRGPAKCLILSDLHIPYHDPTSVKLAIEYGLERDADMVLLNGDVVDLYGFSDFEKDPRLRDTPAEVRAGRQFLRAIRVAFPSARIIFKEGNHEERFERFMRMKAPELLGLPDFTWNAVYGLDEFGVEHVGDKRPIALGKLHVIHGHEYRFAISNPVNPARGFFLRAKVHVIGGHLHQSSQHSENDLTGNVISSWSMGCLCDLHPAYRPLNSWNNGFAFVDVDADGAFKVDNLRVVDGRVW